jgi:hypothetical protein
VVVGSNPGAVYWMVYAKLAITLKKEIKVAKWGTPKKYLKKKLILLACKLLFYI